ncbi:hypothetical protein ZEAMMB73_Zm00001d011604 [Zea mays]|uniref:Uncharacterized protein n=1 Tax=Zea mays TaxID=4577 RepID=A0A1D6G1Y5_MAIZE|nr:hypothetical protein ZEAMMB73_Zm00001d011604 [Zea mays]AQK97404.1 hypothetical protein ZEAMMB73_Zm00001d011604 [Zea mays]AQK97405.1 hypothetical protein ZEAMMB73_Zm00001d011604 [Zea mays]AQK97406.1 hypothetical protein ZEAMMB73_Zm00001d011604 [Zea mays]AQK97409.1 hypothetical protein ZEAMMB73_Zm00001d011604 [Zea mays]
MVWHLLSQIPNMLRRRLPHWNSCAPLAFLLPFNPQAFPGSIAQLGDVRRYLHIGNDRFRFSGDAWSGSRINQNKCEISVKFERLLNFQIRYQPKKVTLLTAYCVGKACQCDNRETNGELCSFC